MQPEATWRQCGICIDATLMQSILLTIDATLLQSISLTIYPYPEVGQAQQNMAGAAIEAIDVACIRTLSVDDTSVAMRPL